MANAIAESQTVREVVVRYPGTRELLEKLGIDYCCGGSHTLREAAAEKRVDLEKVLAALREAVAARPRQTEDARDWSAALLAELADHIEERHHAFMKLQLPRLKSMLDKVLAAHGLAHGRMLADLRETYDGLREELDEHLLKEEEILFPSIRRMEAFAKGGGVRPQSPCGSVRHPIGQMEFEHESAGRALARMREITSDYALPDDACPTFRALYDGMKALEADLHEHIHLENNILFPKAVELEKAL